MLDYINGNKFADLAHVVIDLDNREIGFDKTNNAIIFCKTDFIKQLFTYLEDATAKFVLITGMADKPINEDRFKLKPKCIKKWFAVNAVYNHKDLISIPLGLENHKGSSKGGYTNHKWFEDNRDKLAFNTKEDYLYCNWVDSTNENRCFVIDNLYKTQLPLRIESDLSYEDYCTNMSECKFVVCPEGNGVDTHRVWEALYMACIPIVIKHPIYDNYDLPMLKVDSFEDITQNMLVDFKPWHYMNDEMYMFYWRDQINKTFEEL
jgi:hypothetical protein